MSASMVATKSPDARESPANNAASLPKLRENEIRSDSEVFAMDLGLLFYDVEGSICRAVIDENYLKFRRGGGSSL